MQVQLKHLLVTLAFACGTSGPDTGHDVMWFDPHDGPSRPACRDVLDTDPWDLTVSDDALSTDTELFACDAICYQGAGWKAESVTSCTGPTRLESDTDEPQVYRFRCTGVRNLGTVCD
jgi:hypothetical protein